MTLEQFRATRQLMVRNGSQPIFRYLRRNPFLDLSIEIRNKEKTFLLEDDQSSFESNDLQELEALLFTRALQQESAWLKKRNRCCDPESGRRND